MEVYYKFKSAKDYDSIPIDWHYTTVSDLIDYILKKKCSGKRNKNNYDNLILTNADTNQDYLDGQTLIPKNTYLIIRRAPSCSCLPIVITPPVTDADQEDNLLAGNKLGDDFVEATKNSFDEPSVSMYPQESEWEEFWNDLSPPEIVVPVQDASPSKADEDSKIKALINTPALDWWQYQNTTDSSFGASRGFGRGGMGGRRGGRGGLLEGMTPPSSYICRRCKVPGHFIQHCPTNGDPAFDFKRTKPPTGIPQSMLMATPDGSYALQNGVVAALKPNEVSFENEIQGIPSTRSVADLPTELYCPLCRAVIKDAALASKCCFESFCDKCIRDYIISNSVCYCGAKNVLADDLIPNKTLRDTIVRILQSSNCSGANNGSAFQPQVMDSARCLQLKIPSSTLSASSKGLILAPKNEGSTKAEGMTEPVEVDNVTQKTLGEVTFGEGAEVSEATHGCAKEPGSQMCPLVTDEEMQQKPGEGGNQKKKFGDMQSRPHQDFVAENYMMPRETSGYSPYLYGMQPKFDRFGRPCGGQMPSMGYGLGPASIPFGGAFHHDPFEAQAYMMPIPPHRDLAEFWMGFNGGGGPPIMSREESEALKTTIKQKRDLEGSGGSMEVSVVRNFSRDIIGKEDVPSMKSKFKSITPPEYHHPRPQLERPSPECSTHDAELIRTSSKRKVKHDDDHYEEHHHQPLKKVRVHHHQSELVSDTRPPILPDTVDLPPLPSQSSTKKTISDWKRKASVLARIRFPEGESAAFKKRNLGSSSPAVNWSSNHRSHSTTSNGYHEDHRKTAAMSKNSYKYYADHHDYELSDDDRHLKRRPARYESSHTPALTEGRHSGKEWREKGVIATSIGRLSVY